MGQHRPVRVASGARNREILVSVDDQVFSPADLTVLDFFVDMLRASGDAYR